MRARRFVNEHVGVKLWVGRATGDRPRGALPPLVARTLSCRLSNDRLLVDLSTHHRHQLTGVL